ncbi:MAG TPA: phosphotransferase [Roseiflexaceae bacterium]|nr:phosphotransferase [Roseiflexaceae bacterium]
MSAVGRSQAESVDLWQGLRKFAALPDWLEAATTPEPFCNALVAALPELASGALEIRECDIGHVRIKRDVWTATYTLTMAAPGAAETQTHQLRGTIIPPGRMHANSATDMPSAIPFGAQGWQISLPEVGVSLERAPDDVALPGLPILTNRESARELLQEHIRLAGPEYHDLRIESCDLKIMRYTVGSRCTVLYTLHYPPELAHNRTWPEFVVAKTYKGGKGKHAYASMQALWNSAFRKEAGVTLAEPLAYIPSMNVLVQGPIREQQTLQALMASAMRTGSPAVAAELLAILRKTAAGLAALHQSGVLVGPVRTWDDELAEVQSVVDDLASAIPDIAGWAEPLLSRLHEKAQEHGADPIGAVHGTFRPGQVLINNGEIGFIDFDSFCRSEPALDLSLFLRRTKDIVLNAVSTGTAAPIDDTRRAALLAQADELCEAFLNEYEAHHPVSRARIALWEALDLLTLVLHSWTKVKPERLANAMFALESHLRTMGF